MTERLVIQQWPGCWRLISRARLTGPAGGTPAGADLQAAVAAVDGIEVGAVTGHLMNVFLIHDALWSWGEVEPAVVAAFATVLGDDVEVIREDKRTATPAPVVPQ